LLLGLKALHYIDFTSREPVVQLAVEFAVGVGVPCIRIIIKAEALVLFYAIVEFVLIHFSN
jgi:hypothetical protein